MQEPKEGSRGGRRANRNSLALSLSLSLSLPLSLSHWCTTCKPQHSLLLLLRRLLYHRFGGRHGGGRHELGAPPKVLLHLGTEAFGRFGPEFGLQELPQEGEEVVIVHHELLQACELLRTHALMSEAAFKVRLRAREENGGDLLGEGLRVQALELGQLCDRVAYARDAHPNGSLCGLLRAHLGARRWPCRGRSLHKELAQDLLVGQDRLPCAVVRRPGRWQLV